VRASFRSSRGICVACHDAYSEHGFLIFSSARDGIINWFFGSFCAVSFSGGLFWFMNMFSVGPVSSMPLLWSHIAQLQRVMTRGQCSPNILDPATCAAAVVVRLLIQQWLRYQIWITRVIFCRLSRGRVVFHCFSRHFTSFHRWDDVPTNRAVACSMVLEGANRRHQARFRLFSAL